MREHCYSQLHDALSDNYEKCRDTSSDALDVHSVARELEYETLCGTKLANKYKLDVFNLVSINFTNNVIDAVTTSSICCEGSIIISHQRSVYL